jgi:hypothetical protein
VHPTDRTTAAPRSAKMRSFTCAPWKRLRIFEGIVGVFQDAHFRKIVRIFEGGAHLRRPILNPKNATRTRQSFTTKAQRHQERPRRRELRRKNGERGTRRPSARTAASVSSVTFCSFLPFFVSSCLGGNNRPSLISDRCRIQETCSDRAGFRGRPHGKGSDEAA